MSFPTASHTPEENTEENIEKDIEKNIERNIERNIEKETEKNKVLARLTIDKLVHGGDGFGRLESGEVVFVRGSVPGDVLEVALEKGPGKTKRGVIQKIIEASPDRLPVEHPSVECDWEHIKLPAQRFWKQQIVEETLKRLGRLPNVSVAPLLASEDETSATGYRNKARLFVKDKPEETGIQIGYFEHGTHKVAPLVHCLSMPSTFLDLVKYLQEHLPKGTGTESIQIRGNETGEMVLTLFGDKFNAQAVEPMLPELIQTFPALVGVDHLSGGKQFGLHGRGYLVFKLGTKEFQVSSPSFYQVNTGALPLIMGQLEKWLPEKMSSLWDLYAGVGTFAIYFKARTEKLLAIENSKIAVSDGHFNMERNDSPALSLRLGDAEVVLKELDEDVDVVILDPPRSGCHKDVITWVNEHVKKQLIYISCDPATLARDLRQLVAKGWKIKTIQPIDMFPHTHHVETLVNLSKS